MTVDIEKSICLLKRVNLHGRTSQRESKAEWPTVAGMKSVRPCKKFLSSVEKCCPSPVYGSMVILGFSDLCLASGNQAYGNELYVKVFLSVNRDGSGNGAPGAALGVWNIDPD